MSSLRQSLSKYTAMAIIAVAALSLRIAPAAAAGNCLKDLFGKNVQCTANDVSVSQAQNPRNLDGTARPSCIAGTTFSFVADFLVVTTATQRENIGLYFSTNQANQTSALTGICSDNIIAPLHPSSNTADKVTLGTAQYEEFDASPDNCGDTSSSDSFTSNGATVKGQLVTIEVDNVVCQAAPGTNQLSLPACTSWQQPGGAIQCVSPAPNYPFEPAAIPGSPSKCNCNNTLTVPIAVQSPAITVTKSANPTSLTEGGIVTYTLTVSNTSNFGSVTLKQICDSYYGNIATVSGFTPACAAGTATAAGTSCILPQTIATNGSYQCTFTANQPENSTVTDTATANGVGADGTTRFTGTSTPPVTVTAGELPSTATVVKSLAATTAACATVRYNVDVKNTSVGDENLTLWELTDSVFLDITTTHGSGNGAVLGTTCGVATSAQGLGTLLSSKGAGVLPIMMPVGGSDYVCQFDAQFCGGIGPITGAGGPCTGIQNTDTVTATLKGDDGETVTQTPGTLTVNECISGASQ